MGEHCQDHAGFCEKLGGILEAIKGMHNEQARTNASIERHIMEAEKTGGVRDRLGLAEASIRVLQGEISTIKQGYWKACIVSGALSGLIVAGGIEFAQKIIGVLR